MTDHEQQAIEDIAKKIDGLAFYVENDKYKQYEARDIARAIFQTLKASGYQYVPEGFVRYYGADATSGLDDQFLHPKGCE